MIKLSPCLVLSLFLSWISPALLGQSRTLDQILDRMDEVGSRLKSLSAEMSQKKWTEILAEYDSGESGHFYLLKRNDGVYLRKDIEKPTASSLVIREGELIFFQPSLKQAQRYQLGRHRDKAEFLLLGFGSDKEALGKTYQIDLVGQEKLGNQTTFQLELKPRSEKVAAFFVKILLWIDNELWVPIRQQLVEPTGDHLLIRFQDIELNPKLSKSDFDLDLPKGTRVISN
jgi:outer membrane lipoprotein-sorting protein